MAPPRIKINEPELERVLWGETGPVFRAVAQFAESVAGEARALAPIESNQLRSKILPAKVHAGPGDVTFLVGTDPVDRDNGFHYGLAAHEGHREIDTDGLMKFIWLGKGRWVATGHVDATEGTPFLTDAGRTTPRPRGAPFVFVEDESRGPI